jgi:hypothetical protein
MVEAVQEARVQLRASVPVARRSTQAPVRMAHKKAMLPPAVADQGCGQLLCSKVLAVDNVA